MGVEAYLHLFLAVALVGVWWSASRPGRLNFQEIVLDVHCIGGWVDISTVCAPWKREKSVDLVGI